MRYSRQEAFGRIGKEGQNRLRKSKVVIVGIGALGSLSAELLVRAGVGHLILIDRDFVELSNLHRQHLFNEDDIGKPKVESARLHLRSINKGVKVESYFDNLDYSNINLLKSDLILDGTDNFETRFLINEYAVRENIPWIYASSIGDSGYIFNIIPGRVCFNCIFKEISGLETCDTFGVLNTITSLVASVQVNEAIKLLLNKKCERNLLYLNVWENEVNKLEVKKNLNCSVCNGSYEYLNGKRKEMIKFCGSGTYSIRKKIDFENLRKRLRRISGIKDFKNYFYFDKMIVFRDKVLIKANDEKEAKSIYSKFVGD